MKTWLVITLVFIISTTLLASFSLADVKPQLVTQMDSIISINGRLDVIGPVNTIQLNLTVPQNTTYQTVHCNATMIKKNGITFAHLVFNSPSGTIHYSVVCNVHTSAQITKNIPSSYTINPYIQYTQPSPGVQSDDPEIRKLAENITAGETDDFKKLAKLMQWVHDYIVYDESYAGKYLDAKTVLRVRHGVCVEYSTLFAALARSLGYPTRFVGGIAYGNKGPTGHMWVEVYVGKWIPFDPTWDLGGSMDATHIPFYKSIDRKVDSTIRYVGTGGTVKWSTEGSGGEYFSSGLGNIQIKNMVQSNPPIKITPIVPASQVDFSSGTFVAINITSDRFLIIPITLTDCSSSKPVAQVEDPTKVVIMEPNKPKLVYWGVKTFSLDPGYIYTCPLTVNSDFIPVTSLNLKVRKTEVPDVTVSVSNKTPNLGDDLYVYLNSNTGPTYYGVYDNQYRTDSGKSGMLHFIADTIGSKKLMVTTSSGGLWEFNIKTTLGGNIAITSVTYPKEVLVGENASIVVTIKNKSGKEVPVTITVNDGMHTQSTVTPIQTEKRFNFKLDTSKPGIKTIAITATGGGGGDKRVIVMKVLPKPEITPNITIGKEGLVTINLNETGNPLSPIVYIDSNSYSGLTRISRKLPPGEHTLTIMWTDELGNTYKIKKEFKVPQYGGTLNMFVLIFIAVLAITMVLIIIVIYLLLKSIPKRVQR